MFPRSGATAVVKLLNIVHHLLFSWDSKARSEKASELLPIVSHKSLALSIIEGVHLKKLHP
jgi:hypothetical protein